MVQSKEECARSASGPWREVVAGFSLQSAMEGPRKTLKRTKRKSCDSYVSHPAGDTAISPQSVLLSCFFVCFVDLNSVFRFGEPGRFCAPLSDRGSVNP